MIKKSSVFVALFALSIGSSSSLSAQAHGFSMPRSGGMRMPMCGGRAASPLGATRMFNQQSFNNRAATQMPMMNRNSGGMFSLMHPRRAQVIGRDQNLNNSINNNRGHLSGQYNNLESQNHAIYHQEQMDASRNGGYITQGQQNQLNREENSLQRETYYANTNNQFVQNHPLRSQVLGRDANENYQITSNKGNLGGHYGQLEARDQSIARQEQFDARQNGGYITQAQQTHLNQEENRLQNQITRDESGF